VIGRDVAQAGGAFGREILADHVRAHRVIGWNVSADAGARTTLHARASARSVTANTIYTESLRALISAIAPSAECQLGQCAVAERITQLGCVALVTFAASSEWAQRFG
jgi:hypothetical protein